jgi:hypothetical protein
MRCEWSWSILFGFEQRSNQTTTELEKKREWLMGKQTQVIKDKKEEEEGGSLFKAYENETIS